MSDATDTDTEDNEGLESTNIKDISKKSAQIVLMCYFNVNSTRALGVKEHLLPLGKKVGVKCRSLGKYDMIVSLARKLIKDSLITVAEKSNYRNLKREQISANNLHSPVAKSPSSNTSSDGEGGGDTDIINDGDSNA